MASSLISDDRSRSFFSLLWVHQNNGRHAVRSKPEGGRRERARSKDDEMMMPVPVPTLPALCVLRALRSIVWMLVRSIESDGRASAPQRNRVPNPPIINRSSFSPLRALARHVVAFFTNTTITIQFIHHRRDARPPPRPGAAAAGPKAGSRWCVPVLSLCSCLGGWVGVPSDRSHACMHG